MTIDLAFPGSLEGRMIIEPTSPRLLEGRMTIDLTFPGSLGRGNVPTIVSRRNEKREINQNTERFSLEM